MKCSELAFRIEQLQPESMPGDVARLCLLLANAVDSLDELKDEEALLTAWRRSALQLHAASDQHAAMSAELNELAFSNPSTLSTEQVATLLRVIRVQGQLLHLYLHPLNESHQG